MGNSVYYVMYKYDNRLITQEKLFNLL